jgi:hypothetical protein
MIGTRCPSEACGNIAILATYGRRRTPPHFIVLTVEMTRHLQG